MGLWESWKPFFGVSTNNNPESKGRYNLNDKYNTTKLKLAAKNVSRLDRQKFLGMLKEEGLTNKNVSTRQLVKAMQRRGESLRYQQRIKKNMLTTKPGPLRDEEKIAKNVRLTTFDRVRAEAKTPRQTIDNTGLAGNYNTGSQATPTAQRPGATRSDNQDKAVTNSDIHLPV